MSLLLFDSFESDAEAAVVVSNLATAASIRDRIIALIAGRTPTSLADDRFRAYRNERGANFREWAEENVAGAFRRFQVREIEEEGPYVSNTETERVRVTFEIVVAYPQTHRYGELNALGRDDCINADWKFINYSVAGIYSRASFSGTYDCTPLGAVREFERGGNGVDYMTITASFEYVRSTT